jgi:hypothetical protein
MPAGSSRTSVNGAIPNAWEIETVVAVTKRLGSTTQKGRTGNRRLRKKLSVALAGMMLMAGSTSLLSVALADPTPAATASPWPTYGALDYRTPGRHPALTQAEVAKIRNMLARVKPCQRKFLRYAFPDPAENGDLPFVMFFGPYEAGHIPHVLGAGNVDYDPAEGRVEPFILQQDVDYSLKADIDQLGCPKGDVIPY